MEAQTPKLTIQGTYTPTSYERGIFVNLNLQSNIISNSNNKYVLIVLERSDFMKGSKLEACIEGISELIKKLFAENPNPKVDLITFNQNAKFYSLQTKSCDECLQILSGIKAEGVTCFTPVLEMIHNILNEKAIIDYHLSKETQKDKAYFARNRIPQLNFDELAVVFLSGGTGNIHESNQRHAESLRNLIQRKGLSSKYHALSFGCEENGKKLYEMMTESFQEGFIQYIQKDDETVMGFDIISRLLIEKHIKASLKYKEKRKRQQSVHFVSQKRKLEDSKIKTCWEAVTYFEKSLEEFEAMKESFKLCIKFEEEDITLDVPLVFQKSEKELTETPQ